MKQTALVWIGLYLGIAWGFSQFSFTELSISEARKVAQQEKKFLVVYVNNTGCYPCQQVESTTFSTSGLSYFDSAAAMLIQADLNADTENEIQSVTRVTSVPSVVILYPNGSLYVTLSGVHDIRNYLNLQMSTLSFDYAYYVQKSETEAAIRDLVKAYKAGKRDSEFLQELLNQLVTARDNYTLYDYKFDVSMAAILGEYFSSASPEQVFSTERGYNFWRDHETKILSPRSGYLLKNIDSFYTQYGAEVNTKITSLLKDELYNLGSGNDAYGLRMLETYIRNVITSPALKKEFAGYFKRIRREMKKNRIDSYFWSGYSSPVF